MDKETKKEIKNALKFFLTRPMFIWLGFAMALLFTESLFSGNPNYPWITLAFAIVYIFCMVMFMRGLEKARTDSMRYYENKSLEFIRKSLGAGLGQVTYILVDGEPEGFFRKLRMKFGTKYICPYIASFVDTGTEHMKAHARFPVSKRQMFQLKLMGCYKTQDRERAVKALEYLGVDWPLP